MASLGLLSAFAVFAFGATAAAQSTFDTTHPQITANVTLEAYGAWHLGGFCFDMAQTGKAAELAAHVSWEGRTPLGESGPVILAAFDSREERWGAVKDTWGQTSCEEKKQAANLLRQLGETHNYTTFRFAINVHQATAIRDWHFALLTCGAVEPAPLWIRLEAVDGALNMFGANSHFHTSSCPAPVPVSWWGTASGEVGFWVLLLCAILVGCSSVLAYMAWRRIGGKKAQERRFQQAAVAGGAEPVIGRPCAAIGEAKVVEGHVNQDAAAATDADNEKAAADSCV